MKKHTESRQAQASIIRKHRKAGFKVIVCASYCNPEGKAGFRYLCGRYHTSAPKGLKI